MSKVHMFTADLIASSILLASLVGSVVMIYIEL